MDLYITISDGVANSPISIQGVLVSSAWDLRCEPSDEDQPLFCKDVGCKEYSRKQPGDDQYRTWICGSIEFMTLEELFHIGFDEKDVESPQLMPPFVNRNSVDLVSFFHSTCASDWNTCRWLCSTRRCSAWNRRGVGGRERFGVHIRHPANRWAAGSIHVLRAQPCALAHIDDVLFWRLQRSFQDANQ